uniref:Uncharacterized protein n=1 Tax=Aegilops tauschii subsp. strangulata TaxID=200361 RepID=A0A452ZD95_AEGTS
SSRETGDGLGEEEAAAPKPYCPRALPPQISDPSRRSSLSVITKKLVVLELGGVQLL